MREYLKAFDGEAQADLFPAFMNDANRPIAGSTHTICPCPGAGSLEQDTPGWARSHPVKVTTKPRPAFEPSGRAGDVGEIVEHRSQ